jgi:hypothetical protein
LVPSAFYFDCIIGLITRRLAIQLANGSTLDSKREAHSIQDSLARKNTAAPLKFKIADSML